MRVLHVQRVAGIGGSERHLATLLPLLRAAGLDVAMFVLDTGGASPFVEDLRAADVPTWVRPAGGDVAPAVVTAIARRARRWRADLVHTHLIHADTHGQLAARAAGLPGVSSLHSTHAFYGKQPFRAGAAVAGRLAQRTIAISEHVARYAEGLGLVPSERLRVVHYGIDVDRWASAAPAPESARRSFGLDDGVLAFGVASRLIDGKGHARLFDAFEEAAAAGPPMRLLVAGDGPLSDAIATRVERSRARSSIDLLGHVSDVGRFMAACNVLVFPTEPALSEGFGLAALEAMALARPVIATAVGALPEVVTDREAGWVIPPSDTGALAAALLAAARDPEGRRRLGTGAHALARARFGADRMVERTLDVYREVR